MENKAGKIYRELLKTEVFRSFLAPGRKSPFRNYLYYNELAIFSEEPLGTQPGFPEIPCCFFCRHDSVLTGFFVFVIGID
jgi:hypothetical protein